MDRLYRNTDLTAFYAGLRQIGEEVRAQVGPEDLAHLRRISAIGRACTVVGLLTGAVLPNPLSACLVSQGRLTRWAVIGHHVVHDGYRRVPGAPSRATFARGWRRALDWFDVILPDAWHDEHNRKHHGRTGELADPDLVEAKLDWLRESALPTWARVLVVFVLASTWKWTYYAPKTLAELRSTRTGAPVDFGAAFDPREEEGRRLWLQSYLPYAGWHFALLPALFLPFGTQFAVNVLLTSLLAEWLTNLHSFAVIVTNHAGADLVRFEEPACDEDQWRLRQILTSTNFPSGSDALDLVHGWLNYQIEHHLWPNLTLLQYRRAQPRVRALCAEHGIPYVEEGVFRRLARTVGVMVGTETMARGHQSPEGLRVSPAPS